MLSRLDRLESFIQCWKPLMSGTTTKTWLRLKVWLMSLFSCGVLTGRWFDSARAVKENITSRHRTLVEWQHNFRVGMTAKVVENKTKVPPRVRCSCVLWFRLCNILCISSFDLCHRIRVIVLLFSANYCSNANFGHLALVNCNAKLRSVFCCGFLFIAIMNHDDNTTRNMSRQNMVKNYDFYVFYFCSIFL